jgi:hypothetical protein
MSWFNPFDSGGKTTTTSNLTQEQQVAASQGSLAVGSGAKYQEGGAVDLSGASNLQLAPSLSTTGGGNITVTTSDTDVLTKALDAYQQLSAGYGSSLNQFVSQAQQGEAQKLQTSLDAISAAKESQDTAAANRKVFLYIAAIVAALVALFIYRKK